MEISRLGRGPEFDLIRRIVKHANRTHPLIRVGPGDDCAIIGDLAISVDASIENVHFRRDWLTPEEIGWRATAAALSDLAAVGAEPVAVLVSVALPPNDVPAFADSLLRGAIDAAESSGAALAGGDVASSQLLMLDVAAIGSVKVPLLRSHARIDDEVWVTGQLGGSAAAVVAWRNGQQPNEAARTRYARPTPRTAEVLWLRERTALHAMIDVSDGLYGDLEHIAAASTCAIAVEPDQIPLDQNAHAAYPHAVSGGEDYEVAFTVAAGSISSLQAEFEQKFGLKLTRIGTVTNGSGVHERRADGATQPVRTRGYQHFDEKAGS